MPMRLTKYEQETIILFNAVSYTHLDVYKRQEPQTAAYTAEIYKRFRKWNGIPTSLTQNVKDLLESPEIENILENSDFILMLNQAASDRNILAQRLGISPQEQMCIRDRDMGALVINALGGGAGQVVDAAVRVNVADKSAAIEAGAWRRTAPDVGEP